MIGICRLYRFSYVCVYYDQELTITSYRGRVRWGLIGLDEPTRFFVDSVFIIEKNNKLYVH